MVLLVLGVGCVPTSVEPTGVATSSAGAEIVTRVATTLPETVEPSPAAPTQAGPTAWELLHTTGQHSQFIALIERADAVALFDQPGDFTVFAPSDAGFARYTAEAQELLQNISGPQLRDWLTSHIGKGLLSTEDINNAYMECDALFIINDLDDHPILYGRYYGRAAVENAYVASAVATEQVILHTIDQPITTFAPPGLRTVSDRLAEIDRYTTDGLFAVARGLSWPCTPYNDWWNPLEQPGNFIVLIPSQAALLNIEGWQAFRPADLGPESEDFVRAVTVARYHTFAQISDRVWENSSGLQLTLLDETTLQVGDQSMTINSRRPAANGAVYQIDTFLIPPEYEAQLRPKP
ncbi:MAG: fasciclin domain-containing protein [Anaerolineales bacterium]|nr:fasciclin domain-containing protein [Anaerolineales bacterium]